MRNLSSVERTDLYGRIADRLTELGQQMQHQGRDAGAVRADLTDVSVDLDFLLMGVEPFEED